LLKNFLKDYFLKYRSFFLFLLKFFSVYVGLTLVYEFYLSRFANPLVFQVDDFTQLVARQVQQTLQFLGYQSSLMLHEHQASVKLFLNHRYVSRVVEGCNALSVVILFAAFVVAFTGRWKTTIIFIVFGSLMIHVMNVLRIALLSIALYYHPDQEGLLHGVIFPLIIYGFVFCLWVLWVNKFSNYASKNSK